MVEGRRNPGVRQWYHPSSSEMALYQKFFSQIA